MLLINVYTVALVILLAIVVSLFKYKRKYGEVLNIIIKCVLCAVVIGYILGGGFIETMYVLVFFLTTGILDFIHYLIYK